MREIRHAGFEVAGAGNGLTANLHGHEAGNGGHSQGEPTELLRQSSTLLKTAKALGLTIPPVHAAAGG